MRACAGSSPLARGTPLNLCLGRLPIRFIPAYAGNSLDMCRSRCTFPVHPRLRGELLIEHHLKPRSRGSSPLTRGTLELILTRQPSQRFIPAYAGNSRQERPSGAKSTVHPRLRGELQIPGESSLDVYGSSPLTRGTPGADSSGCRNGRFIPAYAGNSNNRIQSITSSSVHPRLRGELAG